MKISYNWIKEFLPKLKTSSQELAEKLTNHGIEVTGIESLEKDTVFELEITTNRGDCLSHLGVAREIAAIYNLPLKIPSIKFKEIKKTVPLKIKIEKPYFCYRYFAQIIEGLKITPSPAWLAERLAICGIRPINNIIDITNYVLLEFGQPLHAFDYSLLSGKEIIVRWAKEKEKILTLDNQERILDKDIPVIADQAKAIALAGIIGGKETAVNENTQAILLESANFDPRVIRRTVKKLGITTESSYRFERGTDWENVYHAARRTSHLLEKVCEGKVVSKKIDLKVRPYVPVKITLDINQVNNLLGTRLKKNEIINYLERLNFSLSKGAKDKITIKVPSYRNDVSLEVDLIEEIARVYGYQNIPVEVGYFRPGNLFISDRERISQLEKKICQILTSSGLNEVINYSLLSRDAIDELNLPSTDKRKKLIPLKNPLSQEMAFLRTTLIPGLLHNLVNNLRYNVENVKIFEIGKVYFTANNTFEEKKYLAGLLSGKDKTLNWKDKPRVIDFYYLSGLLDCLLRNLEIKNYQYQKTPLPYLHPGKAFELFIQGQKIGELGELGPQLEKKYEFPEKVYLFEIELEQLVAYARLERIYQSLPRYPFAQRDISFILPENILQEKVKSLILRTGGGYLRECELFDLYKDESMPLGWQSLTYRLTYYNPQATLTTGEIEKIQEKITSALEKEFSAQIRWKKLTS